MAEEVHLILKRIDAKMDALVRLMASRFVEGKNKTESIVALGKLGLERNLIASIADTTPETVTARLWEARRKESAARKVKKEVETNGGPE